LKQQIAFRVLDIATPTPKLLVKKRSTCFDDIPGQANDRRRMFQTGFFFPALMKQMLLSSKISVVMRTDP
jgi:hypothetical protein